MGFWRVQEIYGLGCFLGVIVSIASRGKYHVANCTLPTHSLPIFVGTSWTRIGNQETLAAVLSGFPPLVRCCITSNRLGTERGREMIEMLVS